MTINKVAVVGSGTMGRAIACNIASANIKVLLLDIVTDEKNRNSLTVNALQYIKNKKMYIRNSRNLSSYVFL